MECVWERERERERERKYKCADLPHKTFPYHYDQPNTQPRRRVRIRKIRSFLSPSFFSRWPLGEREEREREREREEGEAAPHIKNIKERKKKSVQGVYKCFVKERKREREKRFVHSTQRFNFFSYFFLRHFKQSHHDTHRKHR